ncbi:MAG: hypothetical protein MJ156_02320 [Alphaproteobacteria bacterium]|nr:hypothetical protein [Alphaproteobacteria bacterium]
MQLSGPEIKLRMQLRNPRNPDGKPNINIEPFDERCLGSNSYDLHLAPEMKVYRNTVPYGMKPFIAFDKNKKSYSMADWFYDSETTDKLTQTTFPTWKRMNSYIKDKQLPYRTPKEFINASPYTLYRANFEE